MGNGVWVEDRPLPGPFVSRLKDAWLVLTGRADALTWPSDDDPTSWCAVNREPRTMSVVRESSA